MNKQIKLDRLYNKIEELQNEASAIEIELVEGMIKEDVNRGAMLNVD